MPIPELDAERREFFRVSIAGAQQDNAFDQIMVALLYANAGNNLLNRVSACKWLNLVISGGNEDERGWGEDLKNRLLIKMTPEEIAEAQTWSDEWIEENRNTAT